MSKREGVRILAVDDDPMTLRYLRDVLSKAGYFPMVTTDPDEALRLVETERPNLVLLDLMLPGSDGIELMRSILSIAEVPVVFLSAYGSRDEVIAPGIRGWGRRLHGQALLSHRTCGQGSVGHAQKADTGSE